MENVHIETIDTFNIVSSVYDRGRGKWYRGILNLVSKHGLEEPVLDVGCGTGEISLRIASRGLMVVSLDCAQRMVYLLSRKARRRKLYHRVHPLVACLPQLPFRKGVFGSVLAIAVVHNIISRRDRIASIREVYRICRRGGIVYMSVWSLLHPRRILKAISFFMRGHTFGDVIVPWRHKGRALNRFYHLYYKRELERDIKSAGIRRFKVFSWSPGDKKLFKDNLVAIIRKTGHGEE